jgi:hypothetical protein
MVLSLGVLMLWAVTHKTCIVLFLIYWNNFFLVLFFILFSKEMKGISNVGPIFPFES